MAGRNFPAVLSRIHGELVKLRFGPWGAVRKRTASGYASRQVVDGGPSKLRHDCEPRYYQRQRWRDILQRFGRCLSQTEKRHSRYPLRSRWPPILARQNAPAHMDTAERRWPAPMEASLQDQDLDSSRE